MKIIKLDTIFSIIWILLYSLSRTKTFFLEYCAVLSTYHQHENCTGITYIYELLFRELCYVLLSGILMSYLIPFVVLARPTALSCAVLRSADLYWHIQLHSAVQCSGQLICTSTFNCTQLCSAQVSWFVLAHSNALSCAVLRSADLYWPLQQHLAVQCSSELICTGHFYCTQLYSAQVSWFVLATPTALSCAVLRSADLYWPLILQV